MKVVGSSCMMWMFVCIWLLCWNMWFVFFILFFFYFYFVLFCFVLFCFFLFCFVLFGVDGLFVFVHLFNYFCSSPYSQTAEIAELAGNQALDEGEKIISLHHLQEAIKCDEEFFSLFGEMMERSLGTGIKGGE